MSTTVRKRSLDLSHKVSRCQKAFELGKKWYARRDALLAEIAKEVACGQWFKLGDKEYIVEDMFAERKPFFHGSYARPYELKERPARS